ncbi:hypothetical protein [Halomonas halmophila]|uniref:DUF4148 domain-containing protein n=1 Tax=Halomonas halmophila TaxID=252 RepID=A0A4Y4F664_9GAMM|nr:hypothetical protein [Halomonas halmophila]GED22601.1 hypothetical protein HHA01_15780 [Halomonas halmophila]
MKTTLMTATLLLTALPLAAQAGQASERTQQLNEPLAAISQHAASAQVEADVESDLVAGGGSAAMAQARAELRAKQQHQTDIAVSNDPLQPAREATT